MNNKLVVALFCVITLLLGVIIGLLLNKPTDWSNSNNNTQLSSNGPTQAPVNLGPPTEITSSSTQTPNPAMSSSRPEQINEWIANSDGLHGHSLYFENTNGGRFLLEECQSFSYVDNQGKPALPVEDFCKPKIDAFIAQAKGDMLLLKSRQGADALEVRLSPHADKQTLLLTYKNEKISFKRGSRNDLLQQFESNPKTKAAKDKMLLNRPEPPR